MSKPLWVNDHDEPLFFAPCDITEADMIKFDLKNDLVVIEDEKRIIKGLARLLNRADAYLILKEGQ